MMEYYKENKKIAIYGSNTEIVAAIQMLDSIPDLDTEMLGYRLVREGNLRLQIQKAMERTPVKATILVDGNTVYPYGPIIKEFRMLRKSGALEKMSDRFYEFLYLNFDIAHYINWDISQPMVTVFSVCIILFWLKVRRLRRGGIQTYREFWIPFGKR